MNIRPMSLIQEQPGRQNPYSKCDHKDATAKWNEAIKQVQDWMKQELSGPLLIKLLITGLQAWHTGDLPPTNSPVAPATIKVRLANRP